MALILKIKDAKGVERQVILQPGTAVQIQPGDTITFADPNQAAGIQLQHTGNNLVIIYNEGQVELTGFYNTNAAAAPGLVAPAPPELDVPAGDQTLPVTPQSDLAAINQQVPALGGSVQADKLIGLHTGDGPSFAEDRPADSSRPSGNNGSNAAAGSGAGGGTNSAGQPAPLVENEQDNKSKELTAEVQNSGVSPPTYAIASASVTEGGLLVFTVTRTGSLPASSVDFATSIAGGNSASTGDFTEVHGTISFAAGQASQTFAVQTTQDLFTEGNETFTVTLSNPSVGSQIDAAKAIANGTIVDDVPTFAVSAASTIEGGNIVFTVTRTGGLHFPTVSVDFTTADGSATQNVDYTPATTTLSFATGESVKTVTIATTQDALFETNETLTGTLSNPSTGTSITTAQATASILNDEASPGFSITSAVGSEGTALIFTITRAGDAQPVQSVSFATSIAGGNTASPSDISATTGTVTFLQGDTSKTFTVQTTQDAIFEPSETFTVTLSAPTGGASLGTATAQGTILNDDPVPSFAIGSASTIEGNTMTFTVTRTGDAENVQTVSFATAPGTAIQSDFTAVSGTLTFTQGQTVKTFTVYGREMQCRH